jgi:hypothetical protein
LQVSRDLILEGIIMTIYNYKHEGFDAEYLRTYTFVGITGLFLNSVIYINVSKLMT